MSSFTPGPWEVTDDHPKRACLRVRVAGEYAEVASIYDAPEEKSSQDDDDVWRNDPVRIANARLIAAAPELLNALQVAHDLSLDGEHFAARACMLNAIDKATGAQ